MKKDINYACIKLSEISNNRKDLDRTYNVLLIAISRSNMPSDRIGFYTKQLTGSKFSLKKMKKIAKAFLEESDRTRDLIGIATGKVLIANNVVRNRLMEQFK